MTQSAFDKKVYELAKKYILDLHVDGVTPQLIEKYLNFSTDKQPDSVPQIYKALLESAQNANMKSGVIGKAIGGVDKLGLVLYNFEPSMVTKHFKSGWEEVLESIEKTLRPAGQIRKTSRSIWPQFCKTILSGARFMSQFANADEFYKWVKFFDCDDRARPALPMLLSHEVDGLGFPLACDFLKELGFVNFAKPDVHLKDIFKGIGLSLPKANDYQTFKTIIRVAHNVGTTPYNVDKLFWLIGSGYFDDDQHIGNKGRIGNHKKDFIAKTITVLGKTT